MTDIASNTMPTDNEIVREMAREMAVRAQIERGYVCEKDAPDALVTAQAIVDGSWSEIAQYYIAMAQAALAAQRAMGLVCVPIEGLYPILIDEIPDGTGIHLSDEQKGSILLGWFDALDHEIKTAMIAAVQAPQ
jgi:hypothetical protein